MATMVSKNIKFPAVLTQLLFGLETSIVSESDYSCKSHQDGN